QRVPPRSQQASDIAGLVVDSLPVIGPSRPEQLVPHSLAVQVHLVEPQRRCREERAADGLADGKRLAEERAGRESELILDFGLWILDWGDGFQADPLAFPVGGLEETHAPTGGRAVGRGMAIAIPGADFPPALLAARQLSAAV